MAFETEQQKLLQQYAKPREVEKIGYDTLEYPAGLGTHRYPHFSIFYVNASSRSKFLKDKGGPLDTVNIESLSKKTEGTSLAKVGEKSGAIATLMELGGGQVATHKRIKNALCLPMPQRVQANYSADYAATEETGIFGAALAALSSGQGATDSLEGAMNTLAQTAVPGLISGVTGVLSGVAQQTLASRVGAKSPEFGKIISNMKTRGAILNPKLLEQLNSKLIGTVINKRQEQLFQSMKFRSHNMQWLFLPRSKEESDIIFGIIKTFKENMHPELDESTNNSTLIMPSEFDIEFRTGEVENQRINRIATCVLASCSVDYTPIGEFITFAGYSDPVAISLNLIFTELEPLTRKLVSLNY